MSAYKFYNPDGIYFVTFAVVQWIDVFTRKSHADIIIESLKFSQQNKGLVLHGWCLMSNHLHLIISRNSENSLSDILRDFKKYTANQILKNINQPFESRKSWILWLFKSAGAKNANNTKYQFWQQDNHPEELISNHFMYQKLQYMHYNPVAAGWVEEPEHYLYSSARNYAGHTGLREIVFLE
ncbi:transposase [marine bacterium AO1-C]|nr:transposase [marine bacterium AO1-C]